MLHLLRAGCNVWIGAAAAAARSSCWNWVPPGGCAGWLGPATTPSDGYITLNKALFFLVFLKQNKPKFTLACT